MITTTGDIFDKLWSGTAPSYQLYRYEVGDGQGLAAILDVHPATSGTALIFTEECVPSWTQLSPTRLQQVITLGQIVARHQQEMLGVDDSATAFFGDQVRHVHQLVFPKYVRGDAIERMNPASGRMQEAIDFAGLAEMRDHLAFPAELAEYADSELARLSAMATILPSEPVPILSLPATRG